MYCTFTQWKVLERASETRKQPICQKATRTVMSVPMELCMKNGLKNYFNIRPPQLLRIQYNVYEISAHLIIQTEIKRAHNVVRRQPGLASLAL